MKAFVFGAAAALAFVIGVGAHQAKPAPAQAAKPVADAPTIVGNWKMVIDTPNGVRAQEATLTFFLDGKKLTGHMTGQFGRQDIEGEFNKDKFKFSISINMAGSAIDVDFDGKLKSDGTLSGTINFQSMMTMDWKATRLKDEK